ncbi:hemolysin family protein [Georgenia sp. 10Sc9-8]|uniref:Hemolysin family protein n=1 Tax=Georgenia halotolerans TaxID=3028317 RepID=A0ABT5TUJ9_9MICO|nr:hemolysin family protein [Georgenia halotolerans]
MTELWLNVVLVVLFVLVGGVFAASEIALVSLRDSQVKAMAARGGAGVRVARLTQDSNRFLSSVQVGVTLAGFFSASYGAAQIAPVVAPAVEGWGVPGTFAYGVAFVGTTVVISYLSLVLGELVPKRLAMQSAERFALVVATPLDWIATLLRPVIWFLGASTDLVMRLLGRDPDAQREEMGAEELRSLVAGHQSLSRQERDIIVDLLSVGERSVQEVMTPRTEVEFLDASLTLAEARSSIRRLEHSRYPVHGDTTDDILGFVHLRDLLMPPPGAETVRHVAREVMLFPTGKQVLAALTEMRARHVHLAVVVDEYGGTDGIVTLEDVVEEFVGEIRDEYDRETPGVVGKLGGQELSGLLNRSEVAKATGEDLPGGPFDTLGGYVLAALGRVPEVGDEVTWGPRVLRVVRMDGRRVDRLAVRPRAATRGARIS